MTYGDESFDSFEFDRAVPRRRKSSPLPKTPVQVVDADLCDERYLFNQGCRRRVLLRQTPSNSSNFHPASYNKRARPRGGGVNNPADADLNDSEVVNLSFSSAATVDDEFEVIGDDELAQGGYKISVEAQVSSSPPPVEVENAFVDLVAKYPPPAVTRGKLLKRSEWTKLVRKCRDVKNAVMIRERVFRGGCSPEIRPEVWMFLLNVLDFSKNHKERKEEQNRLKEDYERKKETWTSNRPSHLAKCEKQIEADLARTPNEDIFVEDKELFVTQLRAILMTFAAENPDIGYVQGMDTLVSPILSVMRNEHDTFWCFVKFVQPMRSNFDKRMSGVHKELEELAELINSSMPSFYEYLRVDGNPVDGNLVASQLSLFSFEWVFLRFARALKGNNGNYDDTKRFWEVLWTGQPCDNFHLLFALAFIEDAHQHIMTNRISAVEMRTLFTKINLKKTLVRAEQLYLIFLHDLRERPEATMSLAHRILGFDKPKSTNA